MGAPTRRRLLVLAIVFALATPGYSAQRISVFTAWDTFVVALGDIWGDSLRAIGAGSHDADREGLQAIWSQLGLEIDPSGLIQPPPQGNAPEPPRPD